MHLYQEGIDVFESCVGGRTLIGMQGKWIAVLNNFKEENINLTKLEFNFYDFLYTTED